MSLGFILQISQEMIYRTWFKMIWPQELIIKNSGFFFFFCCLARVGQVGQNISARYFHYFSFFLNLRFYLRKGLPAWRDATVVWVVQMWSEFSPCPSWLRIPMNKGNTVRGKIKEDELKIFNCRHLFMKTFCWKKKILLLKLFWPRAVY